MTSTADHLYREAGQLFAPALARLARSAERDPEKARELEQEMHCALWSSLARFDGRCALKTWVYRVAHNVAADHVARSVRGPERVGLTEIETLPDPGNVEAETGEALVLAQVAALIRRLPPIDMQVIVLWLEGETAAAIAEITGLSAGAVNVRVHRIKTLLASHFTPSDDPELTP